jgi:ABC-2 type transport system ATP-binding protein
MTPRLFRAEAYAFTPGGRDVLKSASIGAGSGQITVLFGRNGSGKTTLLRCMVGLTGAEIGTTHFAGHCYERPRLRTLARQGLFYLPDRGLLPRSLRFGALIRSIEKCHGAHPARDQVLNQLRVGEFLRRDSGELSGGEQRRCEWALALLSQPRCIVSDEPLAGTMPRDQDLLIDVLRDEARRSTAIILTGHEVERLSAIGDEFVWMSAGSTHVLGSWEDATAHPGFRREYLGEY